VTAGEVQAVQSVLAALRQTGQRLAGRTDPRLLDAGERPLRRWVERAQAVDFVAEQLDADGLAQVGRPDVHDAAAAAEHARRLHYGFRLVAQADPVCQHLVQVEGLALLDLAQRQPHLAHRQGHLHQRAGGTDNDRCDGRLAAGETTASGQLADGQQADKGFQAALAGLRRPGDALIWERVGVGKIVDRHFVGQPGAQLVDPLPGAIRPRGDDQQGLIEDARERRDQVRARRMIHFQGFARRATRGQLRRQIAQRGQVVGQVEQAVEFHPVPLNWFMAASMPWLSHSSMASAARGRTNSISFSCSTANGRST